MQGRIHQSIEQICCYAGPSLLDQTDRRCQIRTIRQPAVKRRKLDQPVERDVIQPLPPGFDDRLDPSKLAQLGKDRPDFSPAHALYLKRTELAIIKAGAGECAPYLIQHSALPWLKPGNRFVIR